MAITSLRQPQMLKVSSSKRTHDAMLLESQPLLSQGASMTPSSAWMEMHHRRPKRPRALNWSAPSDPLPRSVPPMAMSSPLAQPASPSELELPLASPSPADLALLCTALLLDTV